MTIARNDPRWLTCGVMTGNLPVILSNVVSPGFNALLPGLRFRLGG